MRSKTVGQLAIPATIVLIVLMMVVPLPPFLLDLLLAFNLVVAVVILLTSLYVRRPLDFDVFPSLLLVATLFRLALNVSSTRLVLLHGYAGKMIESFGHFVIGGSVVVGLVVFLILVVIQFAVITAGAGRVAEVAARFTLDAMPGKQMAIDADLNSGLITEDEARQRRADVSAEADFYGAMDGASKFVKGDAIAAVIITLINLFGGFVIGVMQEGLPIGLAIQTYALLTVGDGLMSQIPALLIAVASGIVVTRAASDEDMGSDLVHQIGRHRKALQLGAVVCVVLAILPGLPKLPFLVMAVGLFLASRRVAEPAGAVDAGAADEPVVRRDSPEDLAVEARVEPLELEIGYGLVDLVDAARGGDLLDRVRALRRKLALDLGIVIPPVRTRDSMEAADHGYLIRVHGVEVGRGEAPTGKVLVLGDLPDGLPGTPTIDPVFGLEACWVAAEFGIHAEVAGCTVIDRGSVITAHLAEVVRAHAARLVSRQDVKLLVDTVKATDPVVIDELNASGLTLADVQAVIHALLDEQVQVRDLVRILEAVSARARHTKDTEALTEAARAALGPAIAAPYAVGGRLAAITLEPLLEQELLERLRTGDQGAFVAVDQELLEHLLVSTAALARAAEERGERPVLLCSPALRPAVRRLLRSAVPTLAVVAYNELGDQLQIETVGVVNRGHPAAV